ncbi:MAG: sensor histidine kinase [Gemmatimonadales bacterium]
MLQANRARVIATLTRGMAHDLRNPLQTLALMSVEGTENAEFSANVGQAVEQLAETVTRFSQIYAPVDRGREPIVVADLLGFVHEMQGLQRSLPPVEVRLRVSHGLPPVPGREAELQHALLNLIINAKEAIGERKVGGITLTATATPGWVEISVEDDGPGVSQADRPRIFDPFYTTKGGPALGLGLPVARRLIEAQGGRLETGSGTGGRFVMRLPEWAKTAP